MRAAPLAMHQVEACCLLSGMDQGGNPHPTSRAHGHWDSCHTCGRRCSHGRWTGQTHCGECRESSGVAEGAASAMGDAPGPEGIRNGSTPVLDWGHSLEFALQGGVGLVMTPAEGFSGSTRRHTSCVRYVAIWGTLIAQRARGTAMLGWALHTRRGSRTVPRAPLGMRVAVSPSIVYAQDYHAVTFRVQRQRAQCVMVLAHEGGQALVLPVLTVFQRELHLQGCTRQWSTDILRPGRMPGMASLDAYPVSYHCVRMTGHARALGSRRARGEDAITGRSRWRRHTRFLLASAGPPGSSARPSGAWAETW